MLHNEIYQLEMQLLNADIRKSRQQLDVLIDDTFVEFGASGMIYSKKDILERLPHEASKTFKTNDFLIKPLSNESILVTYTVTYNNQSSLRSSIWVYDGDKWKIMFHQGTNKAKS